MSRIADFAKGTISLLLILALLVGVPALLLTIVGFPLPTEAPSLGLIRNHIEDGNIPDLFVVKTLALVVWVVWIQLAVAVLAEVFALIRGRVAGRAPVMPGIQLFAGKLVASTVLIVSALTPNRAVAAAPIVPLDAAQPAVVDPSISGRSERVGGVPVSEHSSEPAQAATAAAADQGTSAGSRVARAVAVGHYTTKSGDNWWDIAERLLGDGMRWSELRQLNSGRTMLSGEVISDRTEAVSGGWRLDVPVDADPGQLDGTDPDLLADLETAAEARDSAANQAGAPGPLMAALRPHSLVYEGSSGAGDDGPGIPYQVVAGDNLWDIAERHLGDPQRWPEIFEHSTELRQTFGRRITDPNLIWPDSILRLPTDAIDVPPADARLVSEVVGRPVRDEDAGPETEIEPRDLRGVTAVARGLAASHDLPVDDPGRPDQPSRPGRPRVPIELDRMEDPVQPDRSGGPERRANAPDRPDGADDSGRAGAGVGGGASGRGDAAARWAFGAGGLLVASGLLGLLVRARRLRLSESGERSTPAPPPLELVDIETVLRASADDRKAANIHGAIRSLGNRSIVVGEPLAAPEVIRISRDRIEVVQRGVDPDLPSPWLAAQNPALDFLSDRSLAVLPAEFAPDEAAADAEPSETPAPTCVTVGRGLLVNLEAVGVVGIDGPPELAAGLIRSMVQELATGPVRRSIDIRVSDWLPGADLHDHVRCGPLDDLVDGLGSWLEDAELALGASGAFSAYAMRVAGTCSVAGPTVIFADVADAENLRPLVDKAGRKSLPLAIVFSGDLTQLPVQPETIVRLDGDTVRLEPHGFTAAMQYLDVDLVLGAEALVSHARQAPMVLRTDNLDPGAAMNGAVTTADAGLGPNGPGGGRAGANGAGDQTTDPAQAPTEETPEHDIVTESPAEEHEITDQAEDADSGILIRLLGPVEFEGAPEGLNEPERSLLAFLALVGPSTAEQIRDAVWPGHTIDDAGFDRTMTKLRELLGPLFPDVGDGRYRLRSVITDLGSARRWIAQSGSMSGDRRRNLLQLALSDVRGRPFSNIDQRYWQWTADHKMAVATQASSLLMDACFDLCDSAYGANDLHLARWACEVGSLIEPLHETVATRRVQLLQIAGSADEARQVVEAWEAEYSRAASRPAPRGVRAALENLQPAAPHVS